MLCVPFLKLCEFLKIPYSLQSILVLSVKRAQAKSVPFLLILLLSVVLLSNDYANVQRGSSHLL